jgi:hypothetical protein
LTRSTPSCVHNCTCWHRVRTHSITYAPLCIPRVVDTVGDHGTAVEIIAALAVPSVPASDSIAQTPRTCWPHSCRTPLTSTSASPARVRTFARLHTHLVRPHWHTPIGGRALHRPLHVCRAHIIRVC